MKSYKRIIGLVIVLLMVSCALESKFGLPNDEKINPGLIGEWANVKNSDEKLTIAKKGEKTYGIAVKENERTDVLTSYSKTIKGFSIMTVKTEYDGTVTNIFYGFKLSGDTLTFFEVNDNLRQKDFKSEADLLRFFQENIAKPEFFVNPTTLKRTK